MRQEQLEDIEKAQRDSRSGKGRKKIDLIDKSKRRLQNAFDRIKNLREAEEEWEGP